jgi:hypothetical protein
VFNQRCHFLLRLLNGFLCFSAGLNEANDKLILDAELALNADFAKVTGKTIGTVSGLEYSYTHASGRFPPRH